MRGVVVLEKDLSTLNIVLLGLDDMVAAELATALSQHHQRVHFHPFLPASQCVSLLEGLRADMVFCPAEVGRYKALLGAVNAKLPGLPVTVVSRRAEVSEWLDALDAGAWDYCSPPFESRPIRWILQKAQRYPYPAVQELRPA